MIAELALRGDEHGLDLGCGDGVLTARIAERVPRGRVVGIDASQGMIEAARPRERENLWFLLMDINALDFAGAFDVVFSNATLHWVKDHGHLLGNVKRALRDGGRLRFNFGGEGNCRHFIKVVREAMGEERFAGYFEGFEWPWFMPAVDEYRELVAGRGLREVRVWGENADRFFPDVETMVRWVDQPSLVPFLVHVAEADREVFRDVVVKRMIEETRQADGRCFETFRRVNVSARQ